MILPEAVESIRPCIVQILFSARGLTVETQKSLGRNNIEYVLGTGFFVNEDGYVISALHVIEKGIELAETITAKRKEFFVGLAYQNIENDISGLHVKLSGNFQLIRFNLVDKDNAHDLALLKLKRNPFKDEIPSIFISPGKKYPIYYGIPKLNSSRPRDGEAVGISGYPLSENVLVTNGGIMATSWSTTVIMAPIPGMPEWSDFEKIVDVYLADVEVNPGDSGAPVYLIENASIIGLCHGTKASPVRTENGDVAKVLGQQLSYSSGLTLVVPTRYIIDLLNKNNLNYEVV